MKRVIAGVVIHENGRYLMVQEKQEKCYGQWNWPAGHMDTGETPEQAAAREAKEEVGLDVKLGRKLGEWVDEDGERKRVLFEATRTSAALSIQESEILGAAWLSKEQMENLRSSMRSTDWTVDFVEKSPLV